MIIDIENNVGQRARMAFTLVEVMVCVALFALVASGVIYGYAQSDRGAQWSAMSLTAESFASEGLERVRSATWQTSTSVTTTDEIPAPTNFVQTNFMEIPATGKASASFPCYTTISVTAVSTNPPLRQIIASCGWRFPLTGKWFTNTVVTQRASN